MKIKEKRVVKVCDLMTRKPHLIDGAVSVFDAAIKMQCFGCGFLPVGNYRNIIGVITDRDIVTRVVAEDKDPEKICVKEVMSFDPFFCFEEDPLKKVVVDMYQYNIRRILVLDKNRILIGVLSIGDIIRRLKDKTLLISEGTL